MDSSAEPTSKWDPLSADFESIQNNLHFRSDDVEMVHNDFRLTNPDAKICKFFLAGKTCWKGDDCRFLHSLDPPIGELDKFSSFLSA